MYSVENSEGSLSCTVPGFHPEPLLLIRLIEFILGVLATLVVMTFRSAVSRQKRQWQEDCDVLTQEQTWATRHASM